MRPPRQNDANSPADVEATPIRTFDDTAWAGGADGAPTRSVEGDLESGAVLWFPRLAFALDSAEERLLDPRFADPKSKNISLRGSEGELRGAAGSADERDALRSMVRRYRDQAGALVDRLFPRYRGRLQLANTSYRPVAIEGRATSWRQDDTRLHVDAFPSNPSRGLRLLRVFSNIDPRGRPRVWRVGEPFENFAARHVRSIPRPWPGSARMLRMLGITKRCRSEYDHLMLALHDRAKADDEWQRSSAQRTFAFAAGGTWVVFSDQVLHAAMSGQFMMEQTLTIASGDLRAPGTSPLAVLEGLTGRQLLA